MTTSDDRTVHADHPAGEQIVRYDRAGKWYIELVAPSPDAPMRKHVGIATAVRRAHELVEQGGTVHLDLPGGQAFAARYRRAADPRKDTP